MTSAAAADAAIYGPGRGFAEEDRVLADKKNAALAVISEKDISAGSDYRQTEDHFDPEFPDDIFPTLEERATLRRAPDAVPVKAYLIAFVELAERFSYYGSTIVFTNFIQQPLPEGSNTGAGGADGQSGALGKGQQASTGLGTFNSFWVYLVPLLGGYIADAHLGRFRTIGYSLIFSLVGHTLLIISAIPPVLEKGSNGAIACFVIAIIIMGLGTGGFKPNISPLVAEQYRRRLLAVRTKKNGEKYIIDPALTASRIYMYFYAMINIGAIAGQVGMVYCEKYVGFWLAFLLPTIVFLFCPLVLWAGRNQYIKSPPQGSVLGKAVRAIRMCMKGKVSLNPIRTIKNLRADGFWDAARPESYSETSRPATLTWDSAWVNELRRGLAACKVAVYFPIYWLPYNQITNNLTSQSAVLNTHGAPNDLINNIDPIAIIILIPLLDIVFYPILRRMGVSLSPIRKIFWGFMTASAAMLGAAILQWKAYEATACGYQLATCVDANGDPIVANINVWVQTPIYFLIGLSECLASITSLEYAYTKAPKNMRGMVQAVFLLTTAIANAITEAFVPISVDPYLIWNYGALGVVAFLGGVAFFFTFRKLDRDEDALNDLSAGQVQKLEQVISRRSAKNQ